MLSLFTIKPTERNMQLARAAQIYYHQGAYAEKPVEQKPAEAVEKKPVQQAEQKKPVVEKKPETRAEQKKPAEQVDQKKPVVEKKPESKPVAEKKPEAKAEQQKPEQQKSETKAEQKKPEDKKSAEKPVTEQKKPDIEVLDRDGNIVAMLPGVPEEAPKAARTTGFDINNFVKPKQSKQASAKEFRDTKNIDEVYGFMRSAGVPGPFDPMPGFSLNEKVAVLKKYANFNGTHPGLDVLQINTLIMVFNSPDLSRKMVNCGLDPKQVLGVRKFNEVPATKYDSNDVYDFAFEYSISKKKKLVLLLNSIPTYDPKNGWMSAYNISVR